jgi:hypothetical protein
MSSTENRPIVIIACQVLQDLIERLLPEGMAEKVTFMDYGLHRFPQRMPGALQPVIDSLTEPSLVMLGYGLCGNGLQGVKAREHTLVLPRADDCIAILLGSRSAYLREFDTSPGTYYLSKGWLESGSHPLKEYEEYVDKYGEKDAAWVMDQQYQHYERLVLVTHDEEDMGKYRPQAKAVAKYCEQWGMRYEEILGSDRYVRRLLEVARAPETADDEFLVIPPGGEIKQAHFF